MATIIAFEELVAARRRVRAREVHLRCIALLEESLSFAQERLAQSHPAERSLWIVRARRLEELLQYARQWV